MTSRRTLNELMMKEIEGSPKPQHIKDLAKTLLETEMEIWDPSSISKRYREAYEKQIILASRKAKE